MLAYSIISKEIERINKKSSDKYLFCSFLDVNNFIFSLDRNGYTIDSVVLPVDQSIILLSLLDEDSSETFEHLRRFRKLIDNEISREPKIECYPNFEFDRKCPVCQKELFEVNYSDFRCCCGWKTNCLKWFADGTFTSIIYDEEDNDIFVGFGYSEEEAKDDVLFQWRNL